MVLNKKRRAEDEKVDGGSSSRSLGSPSKRSRRDSASFPQTPKVSGTSSSPYKHSFATPRTPYTPYPLHASDSPSNPFGRKRKERLVHSLPPVSSFSKHLALRFQLVRSDISPRLGGVHRIVRVPLNYTFTHLRCLISWLFETPGQVSNGKAGKEQYLFEVKSKLVLFGALYKPGQVKSGQTKVKLSNVRDPGRWPADDICGTMTDDMTEDGSDEENGSRLGIDDGIDEASNEWDWMDEEDYTLSHAWPQGIDPEIGIIYHHSSSTQVHITVNNVKLPRQKGISNTPCVFMAKGRAYLSPLPLPRLDFSASLFCNSSPLRSKSKGVAHITNAPPPLRLSPKTRTAKRERDEQLTDTDADGDTDPELEAQEEIQEFNSNHPFFRSPSASPSKKVRREKTVILVEDSDEEDTLKEKFHLQIDPVRWNEPSHAFALYLLQFMDPLGMSYDDLDESFFQEETVYDPFDVDEPEVKKVQPVKHTEEDDDDQYESDQEVDNDNENEADDDDDDDDEEEEAEVIESALQHTLGSTPGLTHCNSSASSLPPSSPSHSSSPGFYSFHNSSSVSLPDPTDLGIVLEEHYPNKKYSQTPAPPKARRHRLRINRLEKRFERIKKAEFLCVNDEGREKKSESKKKRKTAEVEKAKDSEEVVWSKPVLKEGEIWDPFGDEPEV